MIHKNGKKEIPQSLTLIGNIIGNSAMLNSIAFGRESDKIVQRCEDDDPDWQPSHKQSRPSYAPGQVMAVWNAANPIDLGDGRQQVTDAHGKTIVWEPGTSRIGIWDMGHKTGYEYRRMVAKYRYGTKEFFREYYDPDHYQVEDCHDNRSHQFEQK